MNERIRLLAQQAGDYVNETYTGPVRSKTPGKIWEDGHVGWHTQFNAKFAELIVLDIVNVLESTNEIRHIASTTYDIGVVEGTIDRSINAITEHYGMKKHYRNKNERTMGRKVSSL